CRRSRDRTDEAGKMPALPGSNRRSRQDAGAPGIEQTKPAGCRRSRDRTERSRQDAGAHTGAAHIPMVCASIAK
ncbi:MAG: hypothetical protein K2X77_28720, partial [Candidatus Obscuribacterales bacterium]|nr:hypothetical protein [Candidatus Obscuribacterales bacterium]